MPSRYWQYWLARILNPSRWTSVPASRAGLLSEAESPYPESVRKMPLTGHRARVSLTHQVPRCRGMSV